MKGYDDLIALPHPKSDWRLPMPMRNRAAQFAPFAALTGYDEAVQEAGRRTEGRIELSEDEAEKLNRRLCWLRDHVKDAPKVTVSWFVPDAVKDGGAYRTVTDHVTAWKAHRRVLVLKSGIAVPVEEITDVSAASS